VKAVCFLVAVGCLLPSGTVGRTPPDGWAGVREALQKHLRRARSITVDVVYRPLAGTPDMAVLAGMRKIVGEALTTARVPFAFKAKAWTPSRSTITLSVYSQSAKGHVALHEVGVDVLAGPKKQGKWALVCGGYKPVQLRPSGIRRQADAEAAAYLRQFVNVFAEAYRQTHKR
jgi:hypothetical protein